MAETIRIDMMKGRAEGTTSLSPESPTNDIATSPRGVITRTQVIMGFAAGQAKQALGVYTQELAKGGNETAAQDINNITDGLLRGGAALLTGGAAIAAELPSVIAQQITRYLDVRRENENREFERSMLGANNTYLGQGGGLG
jgi:hypothetical protein